LQCPHCVIYLHAWVEWSVYTITRLLCSNDRNSDLNLLGWSDYQIGIFTSPKDSSLARFICLKCCLYCLWKYSSLVGLVTVKVGSPRRNLVVRGYRTTANFEHWCPMYTFQLAFVLYKWLYQNLLIYLTGCKPVLALYLLI
jgi:hypothetical protein